MTALQECSVDQHSGSHPEAVCMASYCTTHKSQQLVFKAFAANVKKQKSQRGYYYHRRV